MRPRSTALRNLVAALLFAGLMISLANAEQAPRSVKAVQLMGLPGVKPNAKGTLNVKEGHLHYAKGNADVSAASIQDGVAGGDSQVAVGNTIHMMSIAAPYGGGRFLSLFRKEIDTLTVQYRDGDGGLHGAIFTMPVGAADAIKKELVAQGSPTTAMGELDAVPAPSNPPLSTVLWWESQIYLRLCQKRGPCRT